MPFRAAFDCLWCGSAHVCRGPDDVEGWASICPACAGKGAENGFVRFRIRRAIAERSAAARTAVDREMLDYYEARAPEYDDWYLRRGRYAHGAQDDAAWARELEAARRWLEGLPLGGRIVELAAGTGWWSTTLARHGDLRMIDGAPSALALAEDRLRAAGLAAEATVGDVWAAPDERADAVFAGFWLSHVPDARLASFLAIVNRWLRPGGSFAFVDSAPDPASGAADHPAVTDGYAVRRLSDGREYRVVKEFHEPRALEAALRAAGFDEVEVGSTGRFFVLGHARLGTDGRPGNA